jgi:hypothetical protein
MWTEGLHTVGCGLVPQGDHWRHCCHYPSTMQPLARYLPPWLGKTRAPLASVCSGNPQQGIPFTPVTTSHVTQGRVVYESTTPWSSDEGLDLWEAYTWEIWFEIHWPPSVNVDQTALIFRKCMITQYVFIYVSCTKYFLHQMQCVDSKFKISFLCYVKWRPTRCDIIYMMHSDINIKFIFVLTTAQHHYVEIMLNFTQFGKEVWKIDVELFCALKWSTTHCAETHAVLNFVKICQML